MWRSVGRSTIVSASGGLVTPAIAAAMSVTPTSIAVMRPHPSTPATSGCDDVQLDSQVTSIAVPSEKIATALAPTVWPTTRRSGPATERETISVGAHFGTQMDRSQPSQPGHGAMQAHVSPGCEQVPSTLHAYGNPLHCPSDV